MLPLGMENGVVYLLSNAGSPAPEGPFTALYALTASDGSVRWQTAIQGEAVLGSSAIYATTGAGDIAAYRASDGALLWSSSQNPSGWVQISGMEALGVVYLLGEKGGIFAFDASTGRLLWNGGPGQIGGVANGLLITSTSGAGTPGAIYALNPSTGTARWTYTPTQELARITIQ